MLRKFAILSMFTASAFAMHSALIDINNKDIEIGGALDMGQFVGTLAPDTVFLGAKYLKGDQDHGDFVKNNNAFYELDFLTQKELANSGLRLGLGLKVNYTQADILDKTRNFASVPLGLEAEYKLPINFAVPLYLVGNIYYAPEVLCLNDAKSFLEYRTSFDIQVIDNGRITLGYRSINTNYDISSVTYNESYNRFAYAGFKFRF